MRIINEPTAAAIAYGHMMKQDFDRNEKSRRHILVFDLGGGTFDASIVAIENDYCRVYVAHGDTHLGGVDFDKNLVNYFAYEFRKTHSIDIKGEYKALEILKVTCEKAKKNMSSNTETTIKVDCLCEGVGFSSTLSHDQFEWLNMSLFEQCIEVVEKCLQDAIIGKRDINDVVLMGGSARIPKIQRLLQAYFNKKKLCTSLHSKEAVAYGAAIQAAILCGAKHNQDFWVLDVAPFSLEFYNTRHGILDVVFSKNIHIPVIRESASVYEGKCLISEDNHLLGTFDNKTFNSMIVCEIDGNSILTVKSDIHLIVINSGKLSTDEINRMMKEATEYKMEDMEHIKIEKAKFEVEKFVSNMSHTLSSYEKIKSAYKKKLKEVIQQTNWWLDLNSQLNDARMFDNKLKELQNLMDANKVKEDIEYTMKDVERRRLRKARFDVDKFVSEISCNLSNYYNIKPEHKKKIKDAINETNQWLYLNVHLNDASTFEDKLKELQDICIPSLGPE